MLKSDWFIWLVGGSVCFASWYFEISPSDNALMILGVMLSILFGFYITQLTVLIGSPASRFLYEKFNHRSNQRLLFLFVKDYRSCTHICLVTVALLFGYLFFQDVIEQNLASLTMLIMPLTIGLTVVSLLRLKQMFDVMLQLLIQEAPHANRETLSDIEDIRKAAIRKMMQESGKQK